MATLKAFSGMMGMKTWERWKQTENSPEAGLRREEINGVVVCRRAWSRGFAAVAHGTACSWGGRGVHQALYLEGKPGWGMVVGHEDSA